jgi:hypothetical protein
MPTEEKITEQRTYRAVKNYLRNEVFGKFAEEEGGKGWKSWLRLQIVEASKDAYKGLSHEGLVREVIKREVGAVFNQWRKDGALTAVIEKIIREEVQNHIRSGLKISASLEVDVNPKRYVEGAEF